MTDKLPPSERGLTNGTVRIVPARSNQKIYLEGGGKVFTILNFLIYQIYHMLTHTHPYPEVCKRSIPSIIFLQDDIE